MGGRAQTAGHIIKNFLAPQAAGLPRPGHGQAR